MDVYRETAMGDHPNAVLEKAKREATDGLLRGSLDISNTIMMY